jgi:predicted TIM-barrel fold metal-dependent hydrolase
MADYKIFSGDSHVSEPGDLWVERIDKEFQFRAPRIERRERNGRMEDVFIYEGFPPHPVGVGLGAASRTGPGTSNFRDEGKGYADALAGGWDPEARLKDMDIDGVEGEILHTTLGFRLFWVQDPKLQRALFRTYNDWLAEYCSYSPRRLIGVPLISLYDIEEARKELRRCAGLGLRGAMIWLAPPAGHPDYTSALYDPFWADCQEMDMPLVLHEITGGAESRLSPSSYWDRNLSLASMIRSHEPQRTIAQLIMSGVCERFPRIKFNSAENGLDWLPWYVSRVKRARGGNTSFETKLSLEPIDYFYRNIFFTYINEPHAVENREIIGIDNLMFATDYPHSASTWPKSQEIVERDVTTYALTEEEKRKLIHDNVLKLFNIPAPVLA